MLIAVGQLKSGIRTITSLSVKLKNKNNSETENNFKETDDYKNLKNAYLKILSSAYELIHLRYNEISGIKNFYNARSFTKRMFNMISDSKTALDFIEYIKTTFESFDLFEEEDRIWEHDYDYDWRDQIYNPSLCQVDAEKIAKIINVDDDRRVKVLDINCGIGENLCNLRNFLNQNKVQTETFAVCYEQYLAQDNMNIDRVIFQGDKKFTISKNVFDIVLTTPSILLNDSDAFRKANRYIFFNRSVSYLRPGGILVMGIPFYRMSDYLALQILKNFTNVQYVLARKDLVFIIGQKRILKLNNNEVNVEEIETLRNVVQIYEDSTESEEEKEYFNLILPKDSLEVEKFRGGAITDYEISQIYQETQTMKDFYKDQEVKLDSNKKQKPLLPFTLGQIGLILTSGFLDGVIDEGNGYKHVVKGRVRKFVENDVNIESNKGKMNVDEVTGNRVEINLFLPDGTFKSLA